MTDEEKAKELAHDYFRRWQLGLCSPDTESAGYECAMKMAEWKDKQFEKVTQIMIDRACEWLKDMACIYAYWEYNGDTYEKEVVYDTEQLIKDFIKAMEGGEE